MQDTREKRDWKCFLILQQNSGIRTAGKQIAQAMELDVLSVQNMVSIQTKMLGSI
jgi:hypothetical protein